MFSLEFDDIEYDNGYGIHGGSILVEFSPVIESGHFSAHNGAGNLQTYGDDYVSQIEIEHCSIQLWDQDGGELGGYIELDIESNDSEYHWIYEKCLEHAQNETDVTEYLTADRSEPEHYMDR